MPRVRCIGWSYEKDTDDGLGLAFTEALFVWFAPVQQQLSVLFHRSAAPGRRDSLYLKDDDYRLSFLYGSYLTLTNLGRGRLAAN